MFRHDGQHAIAPHSPPSRSPSPDDERRTMAWYGASPRAGSEGSEAGASAPPMAMPVLPLERPYNRGTAPPLDATILGSPMMFDGAALELCGCRILIVYVSPAVMAAVYESQLLVAAFHVRYRRTIVLVTLGAGAIPTYFGPEDVARVLARIPFDALPWRRYRYKKPAPMLPIPSDPIDPLTRSLPPRDRETPPELLTRPERPRGPRDLSERPREVPGK